MKKSFPCLFLTVLSLSPLAHAQSESSEYERGYRDGYAKGLEDNAPWQELWRCTEWFNIGYMGRTQWSYVYNKGRTRAEALSKVDDRQINAGRYKCEKL